MADKKGAAKQHDGSTADHKSTGGFASGNQYRFRPGESGNPAGPKPGRRLSAILDKYLEEEIDYEFQNAAGEAQTIRITRADEFIISQYKAAITAGDSAAAKQIWERIDGKVTETVEHVGGVTLNMIFDPVLDDPDD